MEVGSNGGLTCHGVRGDYVGLRKGIGIGKCNAGSRGGNGGGFG